VRCQPSRSGPREQPPKSHPKLALGDWRYTEDCDSSDSRDEPILAQRCANGSISVGWFDWIAPQLPQAMTDWAALVVGRHLRALASYAAPQETDSRELSFKAGEVIIFKQYGGSGPFDS
jgi:hypothetical protein